MDPLVQKSFTMRIRIILPVIVEDEEHRLAGLIGKAPEKFECEDAVFYSVDNILPHEKYSNLCYVSSGGSIYTVAKKMNEVDEMIRANILPYMCAN